MTTDQNSDKIPKTETQLTYTPGEVIRMIEAITARVVADSRDYGFIIVEGLLGEIKETAYPTYYGIPLRDVNGGSVSIDIPKKLADTNKSYQNKEVTVFGYLKPKIWQGKVSFIIDTTRIEPKLEISGKLKEQEELLSRLLRVHANRHNSFPDKERYLITLIHSAGSQVKPDFLNCINEGNKELYIPIEIESLTANMSSAEDITRAVVSASGDILVLIRGGGAGGEFEVFNDLNLLKTWMQKDTFKITAIGHTENKSYLDAFSDASVDTPSVAGFFVKRKIDALSLLKRNKNIEERHNKDVTELISVYNKKLDDINKQKDETMKQKDEMAKEFTKTSENLQSEIKLLMTDRQKEKQKMFIIIAAIVVVFVVLWLVIK